MPEDLKDEEIKQKADRNKKRALKRKELHEPDPRELESNSGGSNRLQEDLNFLPAIQPNTTWPYHDTAFLQHTTIDSTRDYQTPYPP